MSAWLQMFWIMPLGTVENSKLNQKGKAHASSVFFKLQERIRNNLVRLGESITAELGKIRSNAEGDVFRGLEVVEHACGIASLKMGGFVENVAGGVNTFTMLQPLGVFDGIARAAQALASRVTLSFSVIVSERKQQPAVILQAAAF